MGRNPGPHMAADVIEEKINQILDDVRHGAPPVFAAGAVGVCRKTWHNWRTRARAGDEPYATIMAGIMAAEDGFVVRLCRAMAADDGKLLPGAWILERRFPQNFSLVTQLRPPEIDGPGESTDEDRIAGLLGRWESSGAAADLADQPIDAEFTTRRGAFDP